MKQQKVWDILNLPTDKDFEFFMNKHIVIYKLFDLFFIMCIVYWVYYFICFVFGFKFFVGDDLIIVSHLLLFCVLMIVFSFVKWMNARDYLIDVGEFE